MSKMTPDVIRNAMQNALDSFASDVADALELDQQPCSLLPGQTSFKNPLTRTETIRAMEIGDSVLIAPYTPGEYAREQASLKSVAVREKFHVELKKVTILIEGEVPQYFIRVTRTR